MKSKKTTKTHLKLHRETLLALEPTDLKLVAAGVTSFCRSGATCCVASCNGAC
ncbi:MAG: hypothetical protein QOF89_4419 [Acidobacteriota bacterium]|jgi:hypothetical protein|nr:hypothetical protein [Acidobacteriota bacterium]